jgi:hypothetical protein
VSWARLRNVERGKESDGVSSAVKMFAILPDKMNKFYIGFGAASDMIDSYNGKVNYKNAVCEGLPHRIPDEIGSNKLSMKPFQIYEVCTPPTLDHYVQKWRVIFGHVQTYAFMHIEYPCFVTHENSQVVAAYMLPVENVE